MAAPRTLLVATLAVVAAAFQPLAPVALTGMLLCSDCVRRCTPRKTRLSALTGCVLNFTALAGEAIVIVGDLPELAGLGGRCAQGRPGGSPTAAVATAAAATRASAPAAGRPPFMMPA